MARRQSAEIEALDAEGFGPVAIAERLGISRVSVWRVLSKGQADDGNGAVLGKRLSAALRRGRATR